VINQQRKFPGDAWPEGEKLLLIPHRTKQFKHHPAVGYAEKVIEGRWPELEKALLEQKDAVDLGTYVDRVVLNEPGGERWPEVEPFLIEYSPLDNFIFRVAVSYAINVMGERWPELEQVFFETLKLKLPAAGKLLYFIGKYRQKFFSHDEPWEEMDKALLERWRPSNYG